MFRSMIESFPIYLTLEVPRLHITDLRLGAPCRWVSLLSLLSSTFSHEKVFPYLYGPSVAIGLIQLRLQALAHVV